MDTSSSTPPRSIGRRIAIGISVAFVAAVGGALAALSSRANRYRLKTFLRESVLVEPTLDASPVGTPTDAELATLTALAEVILPSESGVDAGALTRHHVRRRAAEEAGFLAQYQSAVRLLDDEARRSTGADDFSAASLEKRQAIVSQLLWSYSSADPVSGYLEKVFASREALALRRFVVSDLLGAFFSSAEGWAVVGYRHYPGVPAADPLDYTRAVESGGHG